MDRRLSFLLIGACLFACTSEPVEKPVENVGGAGATPGSTAKGGVTAANASKSTSTTSTAAANKGTGAAGASSRSSNAQGGTSRDGATSIDPPTTSGGEQARGGASSSKPKTGGGGTASGTIASGGLTGQDPSSSGTGSSSVGANGTGGQSASSPAVLTELEQYLAVPRQERKAIETQGFAKTPLSRDQAERAAELLWQDYATLIRETRKAEHDARTIKLDKLSLRYAFKVFGQKPAAGRSLYISLHGGGNADPSVNDEQWENQKILYEPDEGIYLAPRAPTDTWNLWHEAHIDPMFERLITDLIVLEGVNPDRIYVMGYSAGGDGVYQLGPRMADHWAAAAAMAGHPNDAQPNSLRNIGFTIHVGALDTAYDRNLIAQEWGKKLDQLEADDPSGYPHLVQVHANKPHWMDLEDAVAVPWMAKFTRNPVPDTVVWYEDDVPHTRSYWLAVDQAEAVSKNEVRATYDKQRITLESSNLSSIKVRLSDSMLDLDQPLSISANGKEQFTGSVSRTIAVLANTLQERGDPRLVFSAEVTVMFP